MIEFIDLSPAIDVRDAEFHRLLGYPRDHTLTGRAWELADATRAWYAEHGRPWIYTRLTERVELDEQALCIDGVRFTCTSLQQSLRQAGADQVALVAVSAGPEIVQESQSRWLEEKPDEYYFLEVFGSAVVEFLITVAGAQLCAWADERACAVLPHYSPGYPEWDVREQPRLLTLMQSTASDCVLEKLTVFDSGMLQPKKSLLGVFGITRDTNRVRHTAGLVPCANCSLDPCTFRRVAFQQYRRVADLELQPVAILGDRDVSPLPLDRGVRYSVNPKVLTQWADTLLSITIHPDTSVEALFRYPGTTCTNMGRPLEFHYRVGLGPRTLGYPIQHQWCGPAPNDTGHRSMCGFLNDAEPLLFAIEHERPLNGRPLDEVLTWRRPQDRAGCYCALTSRDHKWGLVLETIHYALATRVREAEHPPALP